MTTIATRTYPSKPERIAQQIEALNVGWVIERHKENERRTIIARRGTEYVRIDYLRYEGKDIFAGGCFGDEEDGSHEEFCNVAARIRIMANPSAAYLATLDDEAVLAALRGRTVTWRNSITYNEETATVLPNKAELAGTGKGRVFSFASREGGFRSIRLSSIVRVA